MIKRFLIWSEEVDIEDEDWKEAVEEECALNPDLRLNKEELYSRLLDINEQSLYDERDNLSGIQLEHPILVLADLGLWNGRRAGYRIIESGAVSDILKPDGQGMNEWYCDGYNICRKMAHHDGTNYYTYREIIRSDSIRNLLDRILEGKPISKSMLNYYTKSIARPVGQVYGLC